MNELTISERSLKLPLSAIRKLIPLAKEAEEKGRKIHYLNVGQPDIKTPDEFWNSLSKYPGNVLEYSPSQGRPELLEAFEKYYQNLSYNVIKDNILITTGGVEAVQYVLLSCTNSGDEVLMPEPFYTNYKGIGVMGDIVFRPFTTHAESGYHLPDRKSIESQITSRTKAILYSSPGNPTGTVYHKHEIQLLADIAKDNGLYIISDEVYREFIYDDMKYTSIMEIDGIEDNAIMVDSASKRYSACGSRVGCIVTKNKKVLGACLKFALTRLSAPSLEQHGITACINETPKSYFDEVLKEYENRRDMLFNMLGDKPGIVCSRPEGAFYSTIKIAGVNTEDFCRWLLTDFSIDNETVMVSPVSGFYLTPDLGSDEIRLAYVIGGEKLKRAVYLLSEAIDQYKKLRA